MDSIISVGLLPAMKYYDFQNPSPKAFIFPTERFSPQIGQDRISQGLTEMVGKQAELNRCLRVPTHLSLSLATEQRAIIIISKEVDERVTKSSAKLPLWMSEPASLKTALYLKHYSKWSKPPTLPPSLLLGPSNLSHMCSIAFLTSVWVTLMWGRCESQPLGLWRPDESNFNT